MESAKQINLDENKFCKQEKLQCEVQIVVLKSCHLKIDFSLVISGCLYCIHGTPSGV